MRELLVWGYGLLTVVVCVQAMRYGSFSFGAEALAAYVLNFSGLVILFASIPARYEKAPGKMRRIGAGAIALVLVAAGLVLMIRTNFWIAFYDVAIPGPVWLVVGGVVALLWSLERKARARRAL